MALGAAYMAGYVAREKGYNVAAWFFAGLFFTVFALLAVAGLPDRREPSDIRRARAKKERPEKAAAKDWQNFNSNLPKLD